MPRCSRAGVFALGLLLGAAPTTGLAQSTPAGAAGRVKAAVGAAFIVRGGQAQPAVVGIEVLESDRLRTGPDGQLAVMFKDDTRLSLGPDTEIAINQFAFAPAEGRLSMVLRMLRGTMAYVSGRIAKLSADSVRLETPTSVIGVRGTHALVKVNAP